MKSWRCQKTFFKELFLERPSFTIIPHIGHYKVKLAHRCVDHALWCSTLKGGGWTFHMMTILSLKLIIFKAFSKLQMIPYTWILINAIRSYQVSPAGNSYCFLYILLHFHLFLDNFSASKSPLGPFSVLYHKFAHFKWSLMFWVQRGA